jgi:hypothetical protein
MNYLDLLRKGLGSSFGWGCFLQSIPPILHHPTSTLKLGTAAKTVQTKSIKIDNPTIVENGIICGRFMRNNKKTLTFKPGSYLPFLYFLLYKYIL